jgi:hypothetical protein
MRFPSVSLVYIDTLETWHLEKMAGLTAIRYPTPSSLDTTICIPHRSASSASNGVDEYVVAHIGRLGTLISRISRVLFIGNCYANPTPSPRPP